MKIIMVRALNARATNAGTEKPAMVWWWRVREDDDAVIEGGLGWEFKKLTAYASAMQFLNSEKKRRETSGGQEKQVGRQENGSGSTSGQRGGPGPGQPDVSDCGDG